MQIRVTPLNYMQFYYVEVWVWCHLTGAPREAQAIGDGQGEAAAANRQATQSCVQRSWGRKERKVLKRELKGESAELREELREASRSRQGWGQGDGKAVKTTGHYCLEHWFQVDLAPSSGLGVNCTLMVHSHTYKQTPIRVQ